MSLIVDCRFCGERISLRKMPHGKHVPFDVHTDDQHKCTESKSKKKAVKKVAKPKKIVAKIFLLKIPIIIAIIVAKILGLFSS